MKYAVCQCRLGGFASEDVIGCPGMFRIAMKSFAESLPQARAWLLVPTPAETNNLQDCSVAVPEDNLLYQNLA